MPKKLKVVEVVVGGQVKYLINPSIFHREGTTSNPLNATNYLGSEDRMREDLSRLVTPYDKTITRSGIKIDLLPKVKVFEVSLVELKSYVGRQPI